MNAKLSPIISDFESAEQAASHAEWVHAKITKAMADTRPRVPHAEAMDRISAMIDAAEKKLAAKLS